MAQSLLSLHALRIIEKGLTQKLLAMPLDDPRRDELYAQLASCSQKILAIDSPTNYQRPAGAPDDAR